MKLKRLNWYNLVTWWDVEWRTKRCPGGLLDFCPLWMQGWWPQFVRQGAPRRSRFGEKMRTTWDIAIASHLVFLPLVSHYFHCQGSHYSLYHLMPGLLQQAYGWYVNSLTFPEHSSDVSPLHLKYFNISKVVIEAWNSRSYTISSQLTFPSWFSTIPSKQKPNLS